MSHRPRPSAAWRRKAPQRQQPSPQPRRACYRTAFAILCSCALSLCPTPATGTEEPPTISRQAAQRFAEGVSQLVSTDPGHFERALIAFRQAYAESPAWQILGNLGIAADALERYSEALAAYEQYLSRGGDSLEPGEIAQFRADIERLDSNSASLLLQLPPGQHQVVDTRHRDDGPDVVNRYGPWETEATLLVRAGQHTVQIVGGAKAFPSVSLELSPGQVTQQALGGVANALRVPRPLAATLPRGLASGSEVSPSTPTTAPTAALWTLGGGAVAAATAAGLATWWYLVDRSATDRFDRDCRGQPQVVFDANRCNPWAPDVHASRIATGALIAGGLSGALLATGLGLYWNTDSPPEQQAADSAQTEETTRTANHGSPKDLQWAAWLHPTGVSVRGSF